MKEIIIDSNTNTNYLEQKYLNILVEKGYKTVKRILSIDNHKNGTDYLLTDFKIFKDYNDNNFFYSTIIDRDEPISTSSSSKGDLRIASTKTDTISIAKYKKRYNDFIKAFDSIVNHNTVKQVYMTDNTFSVIDNTDLNKQLDCFVDTLTNKVVFIYIKNLNIVTHNPYNFQPSYNMLWNRIEECNNFIYNGKVREEELSFFIGYNLDKFYNNITYPIPNDAHKSCYMNHELEEYLNSDKLTFKPIN